jgi:hypothetical protein
MNTQDLLGLFERYYLDPRGVWPDLFYGIQNYAFDDYGSFATGAMRLKPETEEDLGWQQSNTKIKYLFGPCFVKSDVENYLRFSEATDRLFFIWEEIQEDRLIQKKEESGHKVLFSFLLADVWKQWPLVAAFIQQNAIKKTYVTGYAYSLHQLTANELFLETTKDLLFGFVNLDSPAFCNTHLLEKYGMHFNDQMINWKTGVNFFTCSFGGRHFLPIFARVGSFYYNLLNLHRTPIKIDDEFQIKSNFKICPCGRPCCDFVFIPHVKDFLAGYDYDELMGLRNVLSSKFRWIQFIQDGTRIEVYYEVSGFADMDEHDQDVIRTTFQNPIFRKGSYFQVGAKYPCFWKKSNLKYFI